MADVEGMVRVGLRVLDHHALPLRSATAEVLAIAQNGLDHSLSIALCVEVQVDVPANGDGPNEDRGKLQRGGDFLSDLLS